ncbi:hypothetical protein [Streptomyces sp. NPDC002589]|uniref:hypothetical protein n=1 Tax=unclassified Streptomyces TaxID=2593676 RepID=UPI00332FBA89
MKKPRQSDVPLAVLVAAIDLVAIGMLASYYVLSGLSIGAPDARELQQRETSQNSILVITALFAGGGSALAALFRFWKTSITHLVLTGLPLLAILVLLTWNGR